MKIRLKLFLIILLTCSIHRISLAQKAYDPVVFEPKTFSFGPLAGPTFLESQMNYSVRANFNFSEYALVGATVNFLPGEDTLHTDFSAHIKVIWPVFYDAFGMYLKLGPVFRPYYADIEGERSIDAHLGFGASRNVGPFSIILEYTNIISDSEHRGHIRLGCLYNFSLE